MDIPPAVPRTVPVTERPEGSLGKEVRESALLLGLSLGVTAGLTVALQAVLSVLS
jgi:hypothetical protein